MTINDEIEIGQPWPRDPFPWFKAYTGDILKGTMDMAADEFRAFMLLLFYYWQWGKLPETDQESSIVARMSVATWRKKSEKILRSLKATISSENANAASLAQQRKDAIELSNKRAEAGRKGGLKHTQLKAVA